MILLWNKKETRPIGRVFLFKLYYRIQRANKAGVGGGVKIEKSQLEVYCFVEYRKQI